MLSWVVLNFILVIYSNATQLTYSLIGLLAMARRVIWIRSVRPFVQRFSWNWLFSFFQELNMVLGAHMLLCLTRKCFTENGENKPSPGFFECIEKFSFFSYFFIFFISVLYIVCTPPWFEGRGGGWASNQIFKKGGGLTGPSLLEGGCWERGGWLFSGGIAIVT